ncbi:hypothetical protein N7537_010520 [Penicillium hordei]|uniref:Uncharacterized protein n=1 Tax=Penicillium hordei TaxID=40994 RepID=A0AAD6DV52_9EURO|nr:uncharacterized protein N7537_010520 [Penicillium hordei]KAJ5593616.1 hypothetical protein N7537_010520 [Penicillium hordei]
MTIKWLEGGPQNAKLQANLDPGNASMVKDPVTSREVCYDTIGCRGKRKAVDRKPQATYTFKDCTFGETSMLLVGSAGPTSETVVYRDYGSGRPFLVNGDMDKNTFLRDFCGRREYG